MISERTGALAQNIKETLRRFEALSQNAIKMKGIQPSSRGRNYLFASILVIARIPNASSIRLKDYFTAQKSFSPFPLRSWEPEGFLKSKTEALRPLQVQSLRPIGQLPKQTPNST